MRTLALVSSPLHLFHTLALTGQSPEDQRECVVCFMDQVPGQPNPYLEALQQWDRSPFGGLVRIDSKCKRTLQRLALRKAALRDLGEIVDSFKPERILVGNDRRVEFLYAHHRATQRGDKVQAVYIDDGVYSYLLSPAPPPPIEWLARTLGKVAFGAWCDKPSHVGASSRVSQAVLELPAFAHRHLRGKPILQAKADPLASSLVHEYCSLLIQSFGVDADDVRSLDALILPPRARYDRPEAREYGDRIRSLALDLQAQGMRVGLKHHPREGSPDPLGLGEALKDMLVLPQGIAFEALVPLLRDPVVVADVSSVLLTAKWIQPSLRVFSLLDPESSRQAALRPLFEHLGIPVATAAELELRLGEHRQKVPQ